MNDLAKLAFALTAVIAPVAFAAPVKAAGAAPATAGPGSTYRLVPRQGGGFTHDGPRFRAVVHPDGRVTFERPPAPPSLHIVPSLPRNPYLRPEDVLRALRMNRDSLGTSPVTKVLGPPPVAQVSPYRREPNADRCFLPDGTDICACDAGALGIVRSRANAGAQFENCSDPRNVTVHLTVDLTDEYLRLLGKDPHALEKGAFLSSTFELRMALAARAARATLARGTSEMPARIERLWADHRLTARERRRVLFELWREADRPGGTEAARVRRAIEDLIRRRLPAGSPDAYDADELAKLRARPGGAAFDPYWIP